MTTITVRRNGSFKVEGPFRLVDSAGNEMPLDPAKPVISLCRCGLSKTKPFCDGSHKEANFQGAEAHIIASEIASMASLRPDGETQTDGSGA